MRYLLLLTNPSDALREWEHLSSDETAELRAAEVPRWEAFFGWAGANGVQLNGLELDWPRRAKSLRKVDGEVVVTDGPFLETKEVLGGYFVVECGDLDAAIEVASRIPVAATGAVEIRPLRDATP